MESFCETDFFVQQTADAYEGLKLLKLWGQTEKESEEAVYKKIKKFASKLHLVGDKANSQATSEKPAAATIAAGLTSARNRKHY